MTKKVATGRKVKSRQETTPLGQIATVTAKLGISKQEQWFGSNFRQFSLHFKEHVSGASVDPTVNCVNFEWR